MRSHVDYYFIHHYIMYRKEFNEVMNEINKRYTYINEYRYNFDVMMYELRASTYLIYEDLNYNHSIN